MNVEIKGTNLIITIPFDKVGRLSKSNQSFVHATTNGNAKTGTMVGDQELVIGLNAYTNNPKFVKEKKS